VKSSNALPTVRQPFPLVYVSIEMCVLDLIVQQEMGRFPVSALGHPYIIRVLHWRLSQGRIRAATLQVLPTYLSSSVLGKEDR